MNTEWSKGFEEFHNHVFGDSRYFYYNGLAEELCTDLNGTERKTAEELVLKSLPDSNRDERPVRAAGHLRLQSAIPILEKLLLEHPDENVTAAIVWAMLKIQNDIAHLKLLADYVANGTPTINDLKREDATDLLSEFGKEPVAVDALLVAFASRDLPVWLSARHALYKLFKGNPAVCELLDARKSPSPSDNERAAKAKRIKELLQN